MSTGECKREEGRDPMMGATAVFRGDVTDHHATTTSDENGIEGPTEIQVP